MVVDKVSKESLQKPSALVCCDEKELSWFKSMGQKTLMVIARQSNISTYSVGLAHA